MKDNYNEPINLVDVDDKTIALDDNEFEPQDVRIPHIFMGSVAMSEAVDSLRNKCPRDVYISHPSIIYQVHLYNTSLTLIFQECNIPSDSILPCQCIRFPTFFGSYQSGHWFLSIITNNDSDLNGLLLTHLDNLPNGVIM